MQNIILYLLTIILLIVSFEKDKKKTKMALKKATIIRNISAFLFSFAVAGVFMKKGVKFSNILLFIAAWSTTKIPMVLFEINSLGIRFAMTRLASSMIGIFIIATIVNTFLSEENIKDIYKNADDMF